MYTPTLYMRTPISVDKYAYPYTNTYANSLAHKQDVHMHVPINIICMHTQTNIGRTSRMLTYIIQF
jgi:hypothetical protein